MDCPKKEIWSQYCDGEVPQDQQNALSEHLRTCELCLRYAAQEDRIQQVLAYAVGTENPADGWRERIQNRVKRRRDRKLYLSALLPLGILCAAMILGVWSGLEVMQGVSRYLGMVAGSAWWFELPILISRVLEYFIRATWRGGMMTPSLILLIVSILVLQVKKIKGGLIHA